MTRPTGFSVNFFLAGVPKSASTWIYQCCREHAQVAVPSSDSLKYYDLKYHKGGDWYREMYGSIAPGQVVVDPSPTYFRSPAAPTRIARDHPDAKFIVSLRNPVDRAFSQFWHEKKRGDMPFSFADCLDRFLLYSWYIETGFYADLFDRWLSHFGRDRFRVVLFDDLCSDPETFIGEIFDYMGVDASFRPATLHERVNQAGGKVTPMVKTVNVFKKNPLLHSALRKIKHELPRSSSIIKSLGLEGSNREYREGIPDDLRVELNAIYLPQIERMEQMFDLNLAAWKS